MNDHKALGLSFALSPLPTMPSSASGNSSSGVSTSIFTQAPALWSVAFLTHPFTRSLESPDYGTGHHMSVSSVASVCWSSDLKDLQQLSLSRRLSPAHPVFIKTVPKLCRSLSAGPSCNWGCTALHGKQEVVGTLTVRHVVIQPTRQSAWLHRVTKVQENIAHIGSQ